MSHRFEARALGAFAVLAVRWYVGTLYIVGAIAGIIAIPFMVADGDEGWVYFLVGMPVMAAVGWVVHPWGLQRARKGLPLIPWKR